MPAHATGSAVNTYTWTFPGAPVQIRIGLDLIGQIEREISTTLSATSAGQEFWGILLGQYQPSGVVEIQACESLGSHEGGAQIAWEPKLLECRSRSGGLSVVGYYRTDRDHRIRLRDDDFGLIEKYFPQQHSVFLVIDAPAPGQIPNAGFFFWDSGHVHLPFSFLEFPFDARELAPKPGPAALDSEVAPPRGPAPELQFDEHLLRNRNSTDSSPPVEPHPLAAPRMEWRKNVMMAIALLAALLVVAIVAYNWRRPADRAERRDAVVSTSGLLALKVNRSGSDFEVSWDRSSSAVQQALAGTLTIRDGGLTRILQLDRRQLQEGRILYTPSVGDLDFRLEIATNDHRTQAESIEVLGGIGSPPLALSSIPKTNAARASGAPTQTAARSIANPAETKPQRAADTSSKAIPAPNNRRDSIEPSTREIEPRTPPVATAATNDSGSKLENASEAPKATPEPVKAPPETPKEVDQPEPNATPRSPDSTPPRSVPAVVPSSAPPQLPDPAPAQAPTKTAVAATPPAARATDRLLAPSSVPPVPIQKSNPAITPEVAEILRRAGSKGEFMVSVRVSVDQYGNVKDAEVVSSTGGTQVASFPIKSAAVRAARLWKFRAAMLNGNAVPSEYTIQFQFR